MSNQLHVSKQRFIPAPADEVFALLVHPAQHAVFDGSGSVRDPLPGSAERLSLGAKFGMQMKMGFNYESHCVVSEFEEGRLIAWGRGPGNVWRYILEPTPDGNGTLLTEEWDARRTSKGFLIRLLGFPARNARGITQTLSNIEAHFA